METIIQILISFIPIGAGVVFYFFIIKRDLIILQKDISIIKTDVGKVEGIEEYIKNLSNYFQDGKYSVPERLKNYKPSRSAYYASNSPVKLTEKGNTLVTESGFRSLLAEEKEFFIKNIRQRLDEKEHSDAFFYFAEKYSVDLIEEFYTGENKILDPIRQYIFEKGLIDEKKDIMTALGIYLRDEVIREYGKEQEFEKLFIEKDEILETA